MENGIACHDNPDKQKIFFLLAKVSPDTIPSFFLSLSNTFTKGYRELSKKAMTERNEISFLQREVL